MISQTKLQGIFAEEKHERKGKRTVLYTKNLAPGKQVYGEKLDYEQGIEFREWDVRKSKLGAAIAKGITQIGIKPGARVLYLGCASGTTASHVSDIVGFDAENNKDSSGFVFALDFAPRTIRDIVRVCNDRKNMTAILADANQPETYAGRVLQADAVFQDIAQRNQVEIFLKNCRLFLKAGGFGLLAVKARSIAVQEKPKKVFNMVRQELEKEMVISDYRELEPFERDHCIFVCKKK